MKAKQMGVAFVLAVVMAAVFASQASAFMVDYCRWAWWSVECWF